MEDAAVIDSIGKADRRVKTSRAGVEALHAVANQGKYWNGTGQDARLEEVSYA